MRYAIEPEGMTRPETFLTLARMREEFRIPTGETYHDELLRGIVPDCVSQLERDTSIPIVDRNVATVAVPVESEGLVIEDRYCREVTAVSIRRDTDAVDVFGQIVDAASWTVERLTGNVFQIRPTGAWPDTPDRRFLITYRRGLAPTDPDIGSLRWAAIISARHAYNGGGMNLPGAYSRLVDGLVRLDAPILRPA